jgi:hypothetical protein
MKGLKATLLVALFVVVGAFTATTATAQGPQIIQKDCDTLSFNPPRVLVKFAVVNLAQTPVCSVHLTPIQSGPYPPCEIFSCVPPDPSWACGITPGGGAAWQKIPGTTPCIQPFEKLETFEFIIDPPYCCYRVEFDGPDGKIFATDVFCFQCESPVANLRSTWGSVKARYH